jgi:hypothetical protein
MFDLSVQPQKDHADYLAVAFIGTIATGMSLSEAASM